MKLKHTQKKSARRSFNPTIVDRKDPWNNKHFNPKLGSRTQKIKSRNREDKKLSGNVN